MSALCVSMPVLSNSTRKTGQTYYRLTFKTRALPFLTVYFDKFFVNGVKLIPTDVIINLDAVALAFLIMSEGS